MLWNTIGQSKAASLMIVIHFLDIHANMRINKTIIIIIINTIENNSLKFRAEKTIQCTRYKKGEKGVDTKILVLNCVIYIYSGLNQVLSCHKSSYTL